MNEFYGFDRWKWGFIYPTVLFTTLKLRVSGLHKIYLLKKFEIKLDILRGQSFGGNFPSKKLSACCTVYEELVDQRGHKSCCCVCDSFPADQISCQAGIGKLLW